MIPLRYLGDGEFQAPQGFKARCDKDLVVGEVLRWEPVVERSMKSHNHYFALIAEAWGSLPEDLAFELPSPEHLRKFALIKAGYCKISKFAYRSNADAIEGAAFLSRLDSYAVCQVTASVVTVWQAESQSLKAMGKKTFQESKDKVLTVISGLIGSDITEKKDLAA